VTAENPLVGPGERLLVRRGTKTEIRPGVWRLRGLCRNRSKQWQPAAAQPHRTSGVRAVERELARSLTEAEAGVYALAFEAGDRQAAEVLGALFPGEPVSDRAESR